MNALYFTLSGTTAFFKKPDVNQYAYFTYGQIPKTALLGLFGAVLGLGGYESRYFTKDGVLSGQARKNALVWPAYYEVLKNLHVAVCPRGDGMFFKKVHTFTNVGGYGQAGAIRVFREQWLLDPSWNIFLLLDCPEACAVSDMFLSRNAVYLPYLGANGHMAQVSDVQICEVDGPFTNPDASHVFYGLCPLKSVTEPEFYAYSGFFYQEYLPVALGADGHYVLQPFVYTDRVLCTKEPVYRFGGDKYVFFF